MRGGKPFCKRVFPGTPFPKTPIRLRRGPGIATGLLTRTRAYEGYFRSSLRGAGGGFLARKSPRNPCGAKETIHCRKKGSPGKLFQKDLTMNVSLILAHPNRRSLNHAIARTAGAQLEMNGHNVFFHDLYAENFDPILSAAEIPTETKLPIETENHCKEISSADGIIIVHPNWWGQPPAILKGWVDRIIRPGVAYNFMDGDSGEGVPVGLLKAQTAIVFNTANTPAKRSERSLGIRFSSFGKLYF